MNSETNSFKTRAEAILPFAFATGIMLSSDMLVIFGNFFGHTGFSGFFSIGLSAVIYTILLSQYRDLLAQSLESISDVDRFKEYTVHILTLLPLFVKIMAVLFLATGLLVSSGFVFNEIFVYWFPNFGFAFLLLFFLILLQLLPNRMILNFQLGFIGISVLGFLVLIIAGLFKPADLIVASKVDIFRTMSTGIDIWFIPLLFFIGFDMGFLIGDRSKHPLKKSYSQIAFALSFMVLLFILWGMVTLKHVPLQKLSASTLPHIITARYIWGDVGKLIMGTIVITGSLAAIHGLLTTIRTQAAQILRLKNDTMIPKIIVTFLGAIIGVFMAMGLAGNEILETFIMGVFILWLLLYTLISALSLIQHKLSLQKSLINGTLFLLLLTSVIILIKSNTEPIILMTFMGLVMSASFLVSIFYIKFIKRRN